MYNRYSEFIRSINNNNISHSNFKTKKEYNSILEHVSLENGNYYLKLIELEFPQIYFEDIKQFVTINDKYGFPQKYTFTYKNTENLIASPTSLRYIYHSLLILTHLKSVQLSSIVEIGCGYGGLFLAICYFSKLFDIKIDNYYIIDLPDVCELINSYLQLHDKEININYSLHSCYEYGKDIDENNLFLISNYCFTEITDEHRTNYVNNVFNKVKNGFIVWQTVFGLGIDKVNLISKQIQSICDEKPQTAGIEKDKNYFVYF